MANTYHAFCQTVFLVSFMIIFAYCEEINFNISSNLIEEELTMRCSFNEKSSDITDVSTIIIKNHFGSIVASIEANGPARKGNNIGVMVSGQLRQSNKEGFIKAVWKYPVSTMNGMYQCEISGVDQLGQEKIIRTQNKVNLFEYNFNDVVNSIRLFKLVDDELKQANDELKRVNIAQNATIAELKQRQDTRVIFTAINNADVYVADGSNVVFPRVLINVGSGYDKNTGVFTCPVAGYYSFQVYILGAKHSNVEVSIKVNGNRITSAAAEPEYYFQSGSNAANVRLDRGDRVTVTAIQHSELYGEDFCSFSGHLISPA